MKDNFFVKIESIHLPDRGTAENAHGLNEEERGGGESIFWSRLHDLSSVLRSVMTMADILVGTKNPDYMKDNFFVKIESIHLPDRGTTENAHGLNEEELARRDVIHINIANDDEYLSRADIKPETSPSLFSSKKTGRGPLKDNWRETVEPVMCAYKLVTVHFKWFGFQKMVESFAHTQYPRLFSKFHREVFCWIDNWHGLTMVDIRAIEDKAQKELDEVS
ncbi:unnamed protein product [Toxocara canis]|uniref:Phosphatidylinositol transfer protein n=1 Tax=Toxocara canis TaxID=6265 RepID=A0A183U4X1_TOXCA|nr:unnamed protein product [Toxocara canis]